MLRKGFWSLKLKKLSLKKDLISNEQIKTCNKGSFILTESLSVSLKGILKNSPSNYHDYGESTRLRISSENFKKLILNIAKKFSAFKFS